MSKKTIEDKFISHQHEITTAFSVNDIVDKHGKEMYLKVHQNQFLSYKAGYETAQKESKERLKDAESVIHEAIDFKIYEAQYEGVEYFKKWGVE